MGSILPMLMGGGQGGMMGMQQPMGFGSGAQMPQNLMGATAGMRAPMSSLGTPQSASMRSVQMPQNLMGSPGGAGLSSSGAMGGGAAPLQASPPMPPSLLDKERTATRDQAAKVGVYSEALDKERTATRDQAAKVGVYGGAPPLPPPRPANLNPIGGNNPPMPSARPPGIGQTSAPMQEGPQQAPSGGYGSLTDVITSAAKGAGIDPMIMERIRWGESGHGSGYDINRGTPGHPEESYGPFQLNRSGGLGARFEKETGKNLSDPSTIPDQAKWVANYIAKTGDTKPWAGYYTHTGQELTPERIATWGDSGYRSSGKGGPATQAPPAMGPQQQETQPSQTPQQLLSSLRSQTQQKQKQAPAQQAGGGGGDGKAPAPSGGGQQKSPAEMAGNKFAELNKQRKQTGGWHAVYGNPKATIADLIRAA